MTRDALQTRAPSRGAASHQRFALLRVRDSTCSWLKNGEDRVSSIRLSPRALGIRTRKVQRPHGSQASAERYRQTVESGVPLTAPVANTAAAPLVRSALHLSVPERGAIELAAPRNFHMR